VRVLQGATIVQKGAIDVIACGDAPLLRCAERGSLRRCSGQGDILAGTLAVFAAWAQQGQEERALQKAALAACHVTRAASALAFAERRRSMVAGDLLGHLGTVIESLAPCAEDG